MGARSPPRREGRIPRRCPMRPGPERDFLRGSRWSERPESGGDTSEPDWTAAKARRRQGSFAPSLSPRQTSAPAGRRIPGELRRGSSEAAGGFAGGPSSKFSQARKEGSGADQERSRPAARPPTGRTRSDAPPLPLSRGGRGERAASQPGGQRARLPRLRPGERPSPALLSARAAACPSTPGPAKAQPLAPSALTAGLLRAEPRGRAAAAAVPPADGRTMGNGMCSRRQKRILQTLVLLTVAFGFIYGAMVYYEVQGQLRKAEAVALKYQQHQESLSAQLQVVYEHRSRLEKSLQKERLEHKKAKEDFLVYKLEAQETLNKGRQDSNNRYSSLNVQHQMLKSQHEELKKLHTDLEEDHRKQAEDFSRAVNDHKQRYMEMQQEKGQELSKLKESLYNLREENRQLRKAHQDIHTQLQDVKLQHKNLLSQHDQLVVTLEEHKSALEAAQSQVEEYRQLKDTLKKMPSFQKPESFHQPHVVQVTQAPSSSRDPKAHDSNMAEQQQEVTVDGEHPQEGEGNHAEGRGHRAVAFHPGGKAMEGHARQELNIQQKQEAGEEEEQHLEQVEEEHKKELEEEEMEQAGQPEHLAEDLDQAPEEREWKEKEEENNMLHEHAHLEEPATAKTITRYKSAYEEQLEQQRLAAQRAEEASRLREHQESLHQGRLQEQLLRQQQLQEKELSFRRQAEQDEEQFKHHLSQQSHYDNLDQDIVQGEEQGAQEEDENYERHNQHPQDAEEEDPNNANEQRDQDLDHQAESEPSKETQRKAAVDDVNPADDPNNQGEDEFEEAEQEREETLPEEDKPLKPHDQKQGNPEVEEHLVMVGNPDQEEDNVDEQYQEEGEEEAQGDLTEEKKRDLEHNGEEPYGENDENAEEKMNEGADQDVQEEANPKEGRDENYEEEEEEEEEEADKAHRRGEM